MLDIEDRIAYINSMSANQVVDCLSIQDVERFIRSLGVTKIDVHSDFIVCPTICHNPVDSATTMKLYWYHNRKLFHCYTECNKSMSIYEVYRKYMNINYDENATFEDAVYYVKQFLTDIGDSIFAGDGYGKSSLLVDRDRYKPRNQIATCQEYPIQILDCFTDYHTQLWKNEGISDAAMDKFGIRFSILLNKIIIPHYDINGRLIGVRGRALEAEDIAAHGKYHPIFYGDKQYAYPNSLSLYGIYENKESIKRRRKAIIVEGEKSVLKSYDFFGDDSVAVACCGSHFGIYQINLLTRMLDVNEIIVALDKEYVDPNSDKGKKYRQKLIDMCKPFKNMANFSYIFDENGYLNEKDSPFDKGKEVFDKLYSSRKVIL